MPTAMDLLAIPHKTDAARRLLADSQASRASLAAGLRMLLITIDGRKNLGDLQTVAHSLGLQRQAFVQLQTAGLIAWAGAQALVERAAEQAQAEQAERARRLVRAKFFAIDLAARMLAGRDQDLRDRARTVHSESGFQAWMDECSAVIAEAADAERARLFRERVAAAATA
eukprot:Opistho-2@2903